MDYNDLYNNELEKVIKHIFTDTKVWKELIDLSRESDIKLLSKIFKNSSNIDIEGGLGYVINYLNNLHPIIKKEYKSLVHMIQYMINVLKTYETYFYLDKYNPEKYRKEEIIRLILFYFYIFMVIKTKRNINLLKSAYRDSNVPDILNNLSLIDIENYLLFNILYVLVRKYLLRFGNQVVLKNDSYDDLIYYLEYRKQTDNYNYFFQYGDIGRDNRITNFLNKLSNDINYLEPIKSTTTNSKDINILRESVKAGTDNTNGINPLIDFIKELIDTNDNTFTNNELRSAFNILTNPKTLLLLKDKNMRPPLLDKIEKHFYKVRNKIDKSSDTNKLIPEISDDKSKIDMIPKDNTKENIIDTVDTNKLIPEISDDKSKIDTSPSCFDKVPEVLSLLLNSTPLSNNSFGLKDEDLKFLSIMELFDALKIEAANKNIKKSSNTTVININTPMNKIKINDLMIQDEDKLK